MSSAPEVQAFIASHDCFSKVYIGGQFVAVSGSATFPTISPSTEQVLHDVPAGGEAEINAAVAAARAAADATDWGTGSGASRAALLRALAAKLKEHKDILTKIESLDMGKHILDAAGDVDACCGILEANAALAEQLDTKRNIPLQGTELNTGYLRYEPFGVVAAITPWN
jgi:betaine-aldehyde dehydrogenase